MPVRRQPSGESRGLTGDRFHTEPLTSAQVSTGVGAQLPKLTTYGRPMTHLIDIVANLDDLDTSACLYVARPRTPTSPAAVVGRGESPEGLEYFLEVNLARDAVEVWTAWRNGRRQTVGEMCEAIIYYADNDAYAPVDDD